MTLEQIMQSLPATLEQLTALSGLKSGRTLKPKLDALQNNNWIHELDTFYYLTPVGKKYMALFYRDTITNRLIRAKILTTNLEIHPEFEQEITDRLLNK